MEKHKYALIGDLHSQLEPLLQALNYCLTRGLTPVILGDVFDSRCPHSDSYGVYTALRSAQETFPGMVILRSNHQDKLERYIKGTLKAPLPELVRTLGDFESAGVSLDSLLKWLESMPYGFCFRDHAGKEYRCAHAFFPSWVEVPEYENSVEIHELTRKASQLAMYGPSYYGDNKGRVFWWKTHSKRDWVRVAGHYHVVFEGENSLVLDGGCGGTSRSWFCDNPPELCLYEVDERSLRRFIVSVNRPQGAVLTPSLVGA